jgi:hypothetical protein
MHLVISTKNNLSKVLKWERLIDKYQVLQEGNLLINKKRID